MPKRKSNVEISNPSKKISLEGTTGIDGSLESIERYEKSIETTYEKASQTDHGYADNETLDYFFLLEHIADDLEQNEDITGHCESDEVDGFIQTVKELAEKPFKEIKEGLADTPVENQTKETIFIKTLIRIFSILLNANLSSAKKKAKS